MLYAWCYGALYQNYYCFLLPLQQEPFNGQSTNFSGGGYSYGQGNGVCLHFLEMKKFHLLTIAFQDLCAKFDPVMNVK